MLCIIFFLILLPSISYSWIISLRHQEAMLLALQCSEILSPFLLHKICFSSFWNLQTCWQSTKARNRITPYLPLKERQLHIPNSPELANFFVLAQHIYQIYNFLKIKKKNKPNAACSNSFSVVEKTSSFKFARWWFTISKTTCIVLHINVWGNWY